MRRPLRSLTACPAQRGYTLVEAMIGLALGLLLAAIAGALLQGQLREHRRLQTEARLMQELRSASDIVTRDLRRAGYRGEAGVASTANPYEAVTTSATAAGTVNFRYSRDAVENDIVDDAEQFGFRLTQGTLQMLLGAQNWQALTDAGTLTVTEFSVTPSVQEVSLGGSCLQPCPAGSTTCPPRLQVRSLQVRIAARASADAAVQRRLDSQVRLRNDTVVGTCPA